MHCRFIQQFLWRSKCIWLHFQGNSATNYRWSGKFDYVFVGRFISATVKELLKSDSNCETYVQNEKGPVFFWLILYIELHAIHCWFDAVFRCLVRVGLRLHLQRYKYFRFWRPYCYFRLSVVVEMIQERCLQTRRSRKPQVCRWRKKHLLFSNYTCRSLLPSNAIRERKNSRNTIER